MTFQTEKETEAMLELETRDLPMPDGSTRSISAFRMAWNSYDFILACGVRGPADITKLIADDADKAGKSFQEYFPGAVGAIHKAIREEYYKLDGSS